MKKLFPLLFALLYCNTMFAQPDTDSLLRKIDSLERRIDESHYTRVPNEDFDNTLNQKVKDAVYSWFVNNALLGSGAIAVIIVFLFTIARKLVVKNLTDELNERIDVKVKDADKKYEDYKQDTKENLNDVKRSLTERMDDIANTANDLKVYVRSDFANDMKDEYTKEINKHVAEIYQQVDDVKSQLNETIAIIFNQSLDNILKNAKENRPQDLRLVKFVEDLLKEEKIKNEGEASTAIDTIITFYYYKLNTKKITELIKLYDEKYNVSATSFANASLAFLDKFERSNQKEFRDAAIENADAAIKKINDYGIPYTIKQMVYMLDYLRTERDDEKQTAIQNAAALFNQIKYVRSEKENLSKEIVSQLNGLSYLQPAIDKLVELFPAEIQLIYQKAGEPLPPDVSQTS